MNARNDKTTFAVGKSIINRSADVDLAKLMNGKNKYMIKYA